MADLEVQTLAGDEKGWTFQVVVSEGGSRTTHRVTVAREAYERLAGQVCSPEELVRQSFEFLLEREPKESILRQFDITVIGRYFPEYEREISKRLGA